MARRKVTVFYAWQSDLPSKINRNFIRIALDQAAERLTSDSSLEVEVVVDADTEGVVGAPPVTETILGKIRRADIFAPDLTFVGKTDQGKLIPNPNVTIEYGYALHALTFEAMMPVMNTHFGPPAQLPFDLGHVRHPIQYEVAPNASDGPRRGERAKLAAAIEAALRLMVVNALTKARNDHPFEPIAPVRPPAFFFQPSDVLANFGKPGEQELRFKRGRAIYLRLYPKYADQPFIGRTRTVEVAQRLVPLQRVINSLNAPNQWGAINLQPHGNGIASFTQVFESGEVWGVSEEPFRSTNPPALAAICVERAFVAAMNNYRMVCERDLKLRPPFVVEFGAVGLKDQYLGIPGREFASEDYAGPFARDRVSYRADLTGFEAAEWEDALRNFLIRLYDLAACDRAAVLTDKIVAAHELPHR